MAFKKTGDEMTEESKKEMREQERSRKKHIAIGALVLMLIGVAIALVGIVFTQPYIEDVDHMTDPSIAVRDIDNATYTWSAAELKDLRMDRLVIVVVGALFVAAGYPLFILSPDDKYLHKMYCEIIEENNFKYCPECGLKLSRLERKG